MNYPLNADVHCKDGRFGRSTHIILNPTSDKVSHVVVKEEKSPHSMRLLPVKWIKEATPELILVNGTRREVQSLDLFHQTDFVRRDVPHYRRDPKVTQLWPCLVPAKKVFSERLRAVPEDGTAVQLGARVEATDGRIGEVDEFIVNEDDWRITHLVLREGVPWDKKKVTIPVEDIARIEEKTVYLKISRQAVRQLPTISVKGKSP
ncbi:MAG: PRC-barrel domain-containing protein [Thermodesulfobacteriota bacterium]